MEVLLADEKLMEALEGDDSRVDNDHPGEFTLTNETAGAPRAEGPAHYTKQELAKYLHALDGKEGKVLRGLGITAGGEVDLTKKKIGKKEATIIARALKYMEDLDFTVTELM